MKMKKIFLLLFALVFPLSVFAQQKTATISFERESYDFGKIKETDGPATYRFVFTNTGAQPLIIKNVTTSCGCTAPAWSREPILPGAKGFVSATYDAKDRPGSFEKEITVFSNADRPSVTLKIMGEVVLSQEQMYPVVMGPLRVRSFYLPIGNINKGETRTFSLDVLNTSSSPVKLSFTDVVSWYTVTPKPAVVAPNQKGSIDIVFDTRKNNSWGLVTERFRILVDGKPVNNNLFTITAVLVEDFSRLSPKQLAEAPVAVFDNTTFDFGKIKPGDKESYDFVLHNNGKSDLVIRNLTASCGCTVVKPRDQVVKPGGSTVVKAEFDSSGKTGYQNKTITVITNDPKNSKIVLWIKGEVTSN